jgi:hypothetical protein
MQSRASAARHQTAMENAHGYKATQGRKERETQDDAGRLFRLGERDGGSEGRLERRNDPRTPAAQEEHAGRTDTD